MIDIALALLVTVLGIGFFICIVSYLYRKAEYEHLPRVQIEKLSVYNSPAAWMTYSIIIGIIIAIIFVTSLLNIMYGFSNIGTQQDTLKQQQQQTETEPSQK